MPKQLRDWEAYTELKKSVEDLLHVLPLLQMLCSPAMRPRHWRVIQSVAGTSLDMASDSILLGDVLDMKLQLHHDAVLDICQGAVKELEIEQKLSALQDDWADTRFEFQNFKNKGPVLLKARELQDILDKLEESSVMLSTMAVNKYSAPFKDQVNSWSVELSSVSEVIELWTVVQSTWIHLEAVFLSGEIAKQLPQEAKRFAGIDKSYMALTAKAFEVPNVIQCCHGNEQMRTLLPHLAEQLELCQRSLSGYLEGKRALFPRFYFTSDRMLLEILSHGADAVMAAQHTRHVFNALCDVTFDPARKDVMTGMVSCDGEEVAFSHPLEVKGNVEEYMSDLVRTMRTTLKDIMREGLADAEGMSLEKMMRTMPAQLCILALYISWTSSVQEALTKTKVDRNALPVASKRAHVTLGTLSTMAVKGTSRLERVNLEALVTVQTHMRDTAQELVNWKARSVNEWEWQRRMRVYWIHEKDDVSVCMADVALDYMYEYVGCRERLVVTPLTERVWVSTTQALSMYTCPTIAGNTATGKSETVRELGTCLARHVVTVDCSDQITNVSASKLFKGVAMCGCWACFDNLNCISADVLSMAAQHLQCVLTAMHDRRREFVYSDGQAVALAPGSSFLMTMSPSAPQMHALPENFKVLVRTIAMAQADLAFILRVKLSAAGFSDPASVSSKFEKLYKMAGEVFSAHKHYDWSIHSMRVVLKVLTSAKSKSGSQAVGQRDVFDSDVRLLMTTIRDVNLPRMLPEHTPVFLSLLEDMAPGFGSSDTHRERAVTEALQSAAQSMCLQISTPETTAWTQKLMHAHETLQARHGVGIVGATCAGKSSMLDVLATANTMLGTKHVIVRMYPKTLTKAQMYGAMSESSADWTDGTFVALWRKATRVTKHTTWLVLDGPVDAEWADGLNSALDETKTLALANGERQPMTDSMRLILETDHLERASPGTVSRTGIVHLGTALLTWRPVMEAWLLTHKERPSVSHLRDILNRIAPVMLDAASRQQQVATYPHAVLIANALSLLDALLHGLDLSRTSPSQQHVERLAVFALCWSLGAVLDREQRARFEADCRRSTSLLPSQESGGVYEHQVCVCVCVCVCACVLLFVPGMYDRFFVHQLARSRGRTRP
jgi:dynein heavy chain